MALGGVEGRGARPVGTSNNAGGPHGKVAPAICHGRSKQADVLRAEVGRRAYDRDGDRRLGLDPHVRQPHGEPIFFAHDRCLAAPRELAGELSSGMMACSLGDPGKASLFDCCSSSSHWLILGLSLQGGRTLNCSIASLRQPSNNCYRCSGLARVRRHRSERLLLTGQQAMLRL